MPTLDHNLLYALYMVYGGGLVSALSLRTIDNAAGWTIFVLICSNYLVLQIRKKVWVNVALFARLNKYCNIIKIYCKKYNFQTLVIIKVRLCQKYRTFFADLVLNYNVTGTLPQYEGLYRVALAAYKKSSGITRSSLANLIEPLIN